MHAARLLIHVLVLAILPVSISQADVSPRTIPLPIHQLTETTLVLASQAAHASTESLACDLATNRALTQLATHIHRELAAHRITARELAATRPPTTARSWTRTLHHCRVTVQLDIPVLPRPTSRRPTHEVTRGFLLQIDHR